MPLLSVGDAAPAFSVLTHQGQELTLASLAGKKVLLWFYPKADTPG
jgi:peroxiredoxin Q/BCP